MRPVIYDIAGIGIGPFNLGLAALSDDIPALNCIFLEQRDEFDWHKGMLIENSTIQVPFYADLVTLANPCSKFSYMSFLKSNSRLFQFAIRETNYVTRKEYNQYCKWVISQLSSLRFGTHVKTVLFNSQLNCYELITTDNRGLPKNLFASHLIIGIGSIPYLPSFAQQINNPYIFHSSDYLYKKQSLLTKKKITVIGSGQSAAEIVFDLLPHYNLFSDCLIWATKSSRFFPMDLSKFALEMTSPDYIRHFYHLPAHKKKGVLRQQNMLYKGINVSLIEDIYNYLYHLTIDNKKINIGLYTNSNLEQIEETESSIIKLHFTHAEKEQSFTQTTEAVILATGYQYKVPEFLEAIKDRIQWDKDGLYDVNENYSIDPSFNEIFVQNGELHTHGFNAPDLGMGSYRNACILNAVLGYEHFILDKKIAFQTFGIQDEFSIDG